MQTATHKDKSLNLIAYFFYGEKLMARIAGVNIPDNKHAVISLTYIFGIGRTTAKQILDAVNIEATTKIGQLDDTQLDAIQKEHLKNKLT